MYYILSESGFPDNSQERENAMEAVVMEMLVVGEKHSEKRGPC